MYSLERTMTKKTKYATLTQTAVYTVGTGASLQLLCCLCAVAHDLSHNIHFCVLGLLFAVVFVSISFMMEI